MNAGFPYPDCKNVYENVIKENHIVINCTGTHFEEYNLYCANLKKEGFTLKEQRKNGTHSYSSYEKDKLCVFLNYFENIKELSIVFEENCNYFNYLDEYKGQVTTPSVTQIGLEDFGMSYAIRLTDSRFIIIDGGWDLEPDADKLYNYIKENSEDEKPVIAAWIMTHEHIDHYRCFNVFMRKYGLYVTVEKMLFNFKEHKDMLEEYFTDRKPDIKGEYSFEDSSESHHISIMLDIVEEFKIKTYIPHTGQCYKIGDAVCEFLSTVDDMYYFTTNTNSHSLVFKMTLAGQEILWTGDASFSDSKLSAKYGEKLKSDILQVPHHGFGCGKEEEQIICYNYIKPSVCFLPVSDYNAYVKFCLYKKGTRHLMLNADIDELITGDETRTIILPYYPENYKKNQIKNNFLDGYKSSGSTVWVFTDLDTKNAEDFNFTFLNMTVFENTVSAELYFENAKDLITNIEIKIPAKSFKKICITDANDVNVNSAYFNWHSLNIKGIPENEKFAVRFIANEPIVISHDKHKAAYIK
ncbi:MAG: MBL fold metallo-hydrolase [Ruminococcaceae bacterium]|nr:MBL fold metallo-hydrolase [Oscillospiraceae bacterium]